MGFYHILLKKNLVSITLFYTGYRYALFYTVQTCVLYSLLHKLGIASLWKILKRQKYD